MTDPHGICVQARHGPCTVCGAACGQPCHGTPAHPHCPPGAVHLCRACLAAHDGLITYGDAKSVMHGNGRATFFGWDLVLDPAEAS